MRHRVRDELWLGARRLQKSVLQSREYWSPLGHLQLGVFFLWTDLCNQDSFKQFLVIINRERNYLPSYIPTSLRTLKLTCCLASFAHITTQTLHFAKANPHPALGCDNRATAMNARAISYHLLAAFSTFAWYLKTKLSRGICTCFAHGIINCCTLWSNFFRC